MPQDSRKDALIDIAKHLVTLAIAALGFVITIMFTSLSNLPLLKVTPYRNSLCTSLISFLVCVVFSFLVQAAVLSDILGERPRFFFARPRFLLGLAWSAFMVGAVSLFVFSWATIFGGAPFGL